MLGVSQPLTDSKEVEPRRGVFSLSSFPCTQQHTTPCWELCQGRFPVFPEARSGFLIWDPRLGLEFDLRLLCGNSSTRQRERTAASPSLSSMANLHFWSRYCAAHDQVRDTKPSQISSQLFKMPMTWGIPEKVSRGASATYGVTSTEIVKKHSLLIIFHFLWLNKKESLRLGANL